MRPTITPALEQTAAAVSGLHDAGCEGEMNGSTNGTSRFPDDGVSTRVGGDTRLRGERDTDGIRGGRDDRAGRRHRLRSIAWLLGHAACAALLGFGPRWFRPATLRSNPTAAMSPKREPVPIPPPPIAPTIESNVVSLCPPNDDGRSYRPSTGLVPSGAVMGSGERYGCEPWAWQDWGSTFVVATDPPTTVRCPEPDHSWRTERRRMHVMRVGNVVSMRCSLGQIEEGMPEIETLGEWSFVLPSAGPAAVGSIEVTEPAATPASHRTAAGEFCEPSLEDLAYAPRARIRRALLRAASDRFGDEVRSLGDLRATAVVAVIWSHGMHSCVAGVDGEGGVALVSTYALTPIGEAQYIPAPEELTGTWTDGNDVFAIHADTPSEGEISCPGGTPLHVVGCAWWGSGERTHLGGVDTWICSGRPVMRSVVGDEADCRLRLRWDRGALEVDDNEQCGGMNVRFFGTFRRRPWHPDAEHSECNLTGRYAEDE